MNKEIVEQHWPLTEVEIGESFKLVEDARRTVGVVTAKEGKFTYKIAGEWKTKESIEADLKIFDFLHSQNFSYITKLLKTKAGTDYIQNGSNLIYFLEYIEGTSPKETPENYKKLGEIMAELHSIQNAPRTTDFSANYIVQHNLQDTAKKLPFGEEYLDVVRQLPDFDQFPKTLIHGDIALGNSIQNPNGEIILIDWDEAGIGTTILDIGHPLINQFVSEDSEYKEANAKAFYEGYFSKRDISQLEKEYIFDVALFYALFYIPYGAGPEKRWKRIKWALENRKRLESLYRN